MSKLERYLVEVVLDTGQRYQSVDFDAVAPATATARDMRGRARVVAVTMIDCLTGVARTRPSYNLAAGRGMAEDGDLLEEAFGDA